MVTWNQQFGTHQLVLEVELTSHQMAVEVVTLDTMDTIIPLTRIGDLMELMERITNSGAPLVAGWVTESSSSMLQKRLTVVAEETAAVEEEARIATKNRKTAIAMATATAAAATIATARAETIIDARRTTTTTDKQRTGPRWLPVLETRRPRQSPQSTTMSHQLFKKHKKK